jgi:hypothetical protein
VDRLELERAGEFLEMAATLVRIKAQMLFPRRGDEDEEDDPRADLVRRLLEYEHFREAARLLERAERERARLFGRGFVEPRPAPRIAEAPAGDGWDELERPSSRWWSGWAPRDGAPGARARGEDGRQDRGDPGRAPGEARRVEFAELVAPWGTRIHAVVAPGLPGAGQAQPGAGAAGEPLRPLWIYRGREAA